MAEGDGHIFNNFKYQLLNAAFNLANGQDSIKCVLIDTNTPDIDTDTQWSDISADECSGTGYVQKTLANQATSVDNTNDRGKFDADNVTWTGLGPLSPQPLAAVLWDDTHASDLLIAYWELTTATNGGDYTLQWHTDGILLLT